MTKQEVEDKLRVIEADLLAIWKKDKVVLCMLIIPLLVLKFRSMIIDGLTNASKKTLADTIAKDDVVAAKEEKESQQANEIVKQADENRVAEQNKPVDDNWYLEDAKKDKP